MRFHKPKINAKAILDEEEKNVKIYAHFYSAHNSPTPKIKKN